MLPAVVAHHMPLIYHPLHQLRLRLGKIAGDEEDGLDPLLLQGIQYLPGKPKLIPLIKGQVDFLAVLLEEDSIILAVGLIVQQRALAAVFLILRAAGAPVLALGRKARQLFHIHPRRGGNIVILVAQVLIPGHAVIAIVLVVLILGIAMGIILLRLGGAGVVGIVLIIGGLAAAQQHGPRHRHRQKLFFHGFLLHFSYYPFILYYL